MGGLCPVQNAVAAGNCRASPGKESRGGPSLPEGGRRTEPALSEVEGSARPTLRLALLPVTACYRGRCNSRCGLLVGRGCLVLLCVRGGGRRCGRRCGRWRRGGR